MRLNHHENFQVQRFQLFEKSKKTTVPTFLYFLQYSTFASERPQVLTWGRQTCILPRTPSNLVAPLGLGSSFMSTSIYEILQYFFKRGSGLSIEILVLNCSWLK